MDMSYYNLLKSINKNHKNLIDPDSIPFIVSRSNIKQFGDLRTKTAALRNTLKQLRDFKENQLKAARIRSYEEIRCTNFAEHKAAFISSALNRTKRCIVLDRAMSTDINGTECLLTDPRQVKEAVIKHYKTFAGSPPSITNTRASMNNRWNNEYSPLTNINERIYSNLLAEVTDEEWSLAISSLPNNKAASLSQIPYEMLKHLSDNAALYLRNMVSNCFATSFIPNEWKQAIIYPIPKPQDWNCYLKNTRPITLLDTARKLTTRIMYNRISAVLAKHEVLTGGNFAGLPGGSCNPPTAILEAIINDAQKHAKPLFLFQQDISKAFDSMDTNMLRLAIEHLKIPNRFINLTIEFFSNRTN